ncbi:MAG: hypothetical protein GWN84_17090 [Gammaproteobacteria bacterium]|nr:hypothetical protein [Gammaproteobacteria bacterium]NIR84553.1 hypothetical protein [Gammaproteobacteria bacterium]NIR90456.1 hypothetical protein [Gammaproteobacteria bacterium]NIU05604.1 hypothetical protein [Gammaproteobacteria bacterium]NIV52743.1 hypothetical protein [Gammaproteobacteria bacterium]
MLHEALIPAIGVLITFWGALFLLAPGSVPRIEKIINTPVSLDYVFALRLGWRCEHLIEEAINRPVLAYTFHWDGFIRRRPRSFGAVLLTAGLVILLNGV